MFAVINAKIENKDFPIIISNNDINNLNFYLDNFNKKNNIFIVDKIFQKKKYLPDKKICKILEKYPVFFSNAGIKKKNFKNLYKIIQFLNDNNANKDTNLFVMGGGVIGDMAAFAASIYKRGINLIHIPTTMTSMVDSCVGGKTGINEFNQVNLIGSYFQPNAIFIDLRFLKTLKFRDFKSGLAESIKKSLINNEEFFNFLLINYEEIKKKSELYLHKVIVESIKIKLNLVQNDEKEKSQRLGLNYGHTFGQALESYYGINESKLTHGEAVSLGMICASALCKILLKKNLVDKHKKILQLYNLPKNIIDIKKIKIPSLSELLKLIKNDKKKQNQQLRFIICEKIGSFEIVNIKKMAQIKKSFKAIL